MMKKLLALALGAVLIVFSSAPASATTSIPVKLNTSVAPTSFQLTQNFGTTWLGPYTRVCNDSGNPALIDYNGIRFMLPYWNYTKDDYISISFIIYNWSNNNSVDTNLQPSFNSNTNFRVADISGESLGNAGYLIKITLKIENTFTGDGGYFTVWGPSGYPVMTLKAYECMFLSGVSYWQVVQGTSGSGDSQVIVNAINNQTTQIYNKLSEQLTTQNLIYDEVRNLNQSIQQESQLQQEMINQAEEDIQQAETDGQQSSSDAQTGTQNLFTVLTGFIGALTNLNPSNCNLPGNLGNVDLGTLNLCRDRAPAIVTTIGSLILIGIMIPIVIWTIRKIISMFRSFTG